MKRLSHLWEGKFCTDMQEKAKARLRETCLLNAGGGVYATSPSAFLACPYIYLVRGQLLILSVCASTLRKEEGAAEKPRAAPIGPFLFTRHEAQQ